MMKMKRWCAAGLMVILLAATLCACGKPSGTHTHDLGDYSYTYPNGFAEEGTGDNYSMEFDALESDAVLLLYNYANHYETTAESFLEGAEADAIEQVGPNEVVLRVTTAWDHCADYYYVGEKLIAWASIQCKTAEEADEWYAALVDGAIRAKPLDNE
ncbi:MAG: hypothetical protein AB7V55_03070 [Oscillospiraceae bacterium]